MVICQYRLIDFDKCTMLMQDNWKLGVKYMGTVSASQWFYKPKSI